jgi:hypothetical protein
MSDSEHDFYAGEYIVEGCPFTTANTLPEGVPPPSAEEGEKETQGDPKTPPACGVCMTTELRAGEGYLCLSCIAEGAFRICRDCREAMIQGGRTLRCPQCRGAWSQVVKGGNEDKLAEESLRGVVDAFNRDIDAVLEKYKPCLLELVKTLNRANKRLSWTQRRYGDDTVPTTAIAIHDIPVSQPTPATPATPALQRGRRDLRGDRWRDLGQCWRMKARRRGQCQHDGQWWPIPEGLPADHQLMKIAREHQGDHPTLRIRLCRRHAESIPTDASVKYQGHLGEGYTQSHPPM